MPAIAIGVARMRPTGEVVTVRGVVTAEPGRLGTPPLFALADPTGGIVVRLPEGMPAPTRGTVMLIGGPLADPYGQLEIRPRSDGVRVEGSGAIPVPSFLVGAPGEATEGRLVAFDGIVDTRPTKSTSGDLSFLVTSAGGVQVRVMADASSGIAMASIVVGAEGRFTGIVGQRASKKGVLDGYRVWVRDAADLALASPTPSTGPSASPTPSPSAPSPSPGSSAGHAVPLVSIAVALGRDGRAVTVTGVVTAAGTLLDATGRRIVVQDASGAVEILVPVGATVPRVGDRIRVTGEMGTAYGSPRLRASDVAGLGRGSLPAALEVRGPFTAAHRWRLVRIDGRIEDVARLGERWRAEIAVGSARLVVVGQPGAAIPVAMMVEGRHVTVTGIVRAAYPTATDRRATLLPRSAADVVVRGAATGSGAASGSGGSGSGSTPGGGDGSSAPSAGPSSAPGVLDADLSDLASYDGRTVRVGGLVVDVGIDSVTLDDGTAVGRLVLTGEAASVLALIEPGDALNAIGVVGADPNDPSELVVTVDDPASIVLGSVQRGAPSDGTDGVGPLAADGSGGTAGRDLAAGGGGSARAAGMADGFGAVPGGAGLLSLLGIGLASLVVTVIRRRHARRLLDSRVAVRLATLAGPARDVDPVP